VEEERKVLKMVVKVITSYDDFSETVRDYRDFCRSGLPMLIRGTEQHDELFYDICRSIHTFKGTFSLFDMSNTVKKLHDFADKITFWKESNDPESFEKLQEYIAAQN